MIGRGGRLPNHRATADVAGEKEDQHNNQHETEQSAAVMWGTPPCPAAVIVATAPELERIAPCLEVAEEPNQDNEWNGHAQDEQQNGTHLLDLLN